ncbi:S8 family serine peptidase [Candidatus Fermentibacteria bacterium]|nr:S8 family serine peptidase [Candidatus Fermentibacteria bacterium]
MRSILNPGHRAGCLLLLLCALLMAQPRLGASELLGPDGTPLSPGMDGTWVPDQLIVKFRQGAVSLPRGASDIPIAEVSAQPEVRTLLAEAGVERVRRLLRRFDEADSLHTTKDGRVIRSGGLLRIMLLTLPAGSDVAAAVESLRRSPWVLYAEPNYLRTCFGTPNDQYFVRQWGLEQPNDVDIDATQAWDVQTGDYGIKLGILDSGVDHGHDDLGGGFGSGLKVAGGWDYYSWDSDPSDEYFHGTHVAGIAAALTKNFWPRMQEPESDGDGSRLLKSIGIAGVAGGWGYNHRTGAGNKGAQLWAMKIGGSSGSISTTAAIEAIVEGALSLGLDVMNNSWGGPGYSEALREAVSIAANAGCVFVAAKGNDDWGNLNYPSDYDEHWVLSVGAVNQEGFRARNPDYGWGVGRGSNYGNGIDVVAPGTCILSTMPRSITPAMAYCPWRPLDANYDSLSGTSMAAPHVAGLAALLLSQNPELCVDDVENLIRVSAVDHDPPGYDDEYGAGLIKAGAALALLSAPWELTYCQVQGGTVVQTTGFYSCTFLGDGPLAEGSYYVKRCDVRRTVSYEYQGTPYLWPHVWGRGLESTGWSAANPNYQMGYCHVVSATGSEAVLQSHVYKVYNALGQLIGWYPCQPSGVTFAYTLLGIPSRGSPQPDRPGASSLAEIAALPDRFDLRPIRPNPVRDEAAMEFALPYSCHVLLSLHDLQGREVARVIDGGLAAGYHDVTWQPDLAPSGAYVCRLRAGGFEFSQPMVVMKH